jgi:predicted RNase H-like nuclease
MIAPENRYKITFIADWGTFVWIVMPFGLKNVHQLTSKVVSMAFHEYLVVFVKSFLDDYIVFSDLKMHLTKL